MIANSLSLKGIKVMEYKHGVQGRRFCAADYIEITVHFGCNLKCEHCMIEGTMNWLAPQTANQFQSILDENKKFHQWKGLTLTGAEITLDPKLPEMAMKAREHGFEHIRIQTHGMHLADSHYTQQLVEAGIDEYFISLTAADASTHDAITGVVGSFERTLAGLEELSNYRNVVAITNTVITERSYRQLPDIISLLQQFESVVQVEYWNYWPMRSHDNKNLIARFSDVAPYLREAIRLARLLELDVEVKNFPECLLGNDGSILYNDQPQLEIDPRFWHEFMRNGFHQCIHRTSCESKQCLGVNSAYVNRYGWEADLLIPILFPGD